MLTPNGDGLHEETTVSYSLSTRATVQVEVLDSSDRVVRSLATGQVYRSGSATFVWHGRNASGRLVRDGNYRVRVTAASAGQKATGSRRVVGRLQTVAKRRRCEAVRERRKSLGAILGGSS